MRSFITSMVTCGLSLVITTHARAAHGFAHVQDRRAAEVSNNRLFNWFPRLFRKDLSRRQNANGTCVEDSYYYFVNNSTYGQQFCQEYMNYPNTTVIVDYTPVSTYTDTYTTKVLTDSVEIHTTPYTTATVTMTVPDKAKRDSGVTAAPRQRSNNIVADVFDIFRRQAAATSSDNSNDSDEELSASLSSACGCQTYTGSTVTQTYTNEASVTTEFAFVLTTTTATSTRTDPEITTTTTVYAAFSTASTSTPIVYGTAPFSGASTTTQAATSSSSAAAATPTAPAFTCPEDNNTVVSQMVGNERFDYLVLCDYDLTDPTFYGSLYYNTFGECASACSVADANFSSPVCQGASYYNTLNMDGYNCFLRSSANITVPSTGVDSAILQRIAVGITNASASGTSTESAPFSSQTPTEDAGQMSSSMSVVMANSSTTMPMVTPGPSIPVSGMLVNPGYTSYSTYVSNGSTYSSGTVFSTYYSSNGMWYYSYYTSYTEQWASATTLYQASESGFSVANSSSSTSQEQSGDNGDYSIISNTTSTYPISGGFNETVVYQNLTYNASGTEIASSATTYYFTYQTASSGSNGTMVTAGNGTSAGGSGALLSGAFSSTPSGFTSTFYSSTQTVILNSGATSGASGFVGSGVIVSPTPSTSETVILNTAGTAYSSGFVASGSIVGTGGASSLVGSGVIVSPTPTTSMTVTINTAGTAYSSGFVASGSITSISGANSTLLSGSIPISSPTSPFNNSGAPRIPGSGSSSSPSASLPIATAPSGYPPFNNSGAPRGPGSSSSSSLTGTGPAPYPPLMTTTGAPLVPISTGTPNSTLSLPTAPPNYPFNNSGAPRSPYPYQSSSFIPSSNSTALGPTAPSSIPPFNNSGAPRSPYSTSSLPTGTGATTVIPPPLTTAPSTCSNMTMGTTTVYETTTLFGCYSECAPNAWGGYGGPESFGPPVFLTSPGASPAATTSS